MQKDDTDYIIWIILPIILFVQFFVKDVLFGKRKANKSKPPFRPLQDQFLETLHQHFLYYQHLSEENKRRFEVRVQAFIDNNEFIPRGYKEVTDEMKALIAASAIQLTFGFPHLNFEHFGKILLYPDNYRSRITHKYHQGEVNPNGLIVLSWRNFVSGYKDHSDGRNLGLHEMAHALKLENGIYNNEYGFIDDRHLEHFNELAQQEIARIKRGQSLFFRHYASMNLHEFFAVAVENFFERSVEFSFYNSELYDTLSELLKQDPQRLFKGSPYLH